MSTFLEIVRGGLADLKMLPEAAPVLVAVSGGPDSVCLLHVLIELGYPVEVAHFDHRTRDGGSARDAAFVRELAHALGAPYHEASVDIPALAAESPKSFEEVAREERYRFFVDTVRETGCQAVATGHHADDQAETVLMRVLRGTGPRGLVGIPAVTEREGVRVVRPLLDLDRTDILAYLRAGGHGWCADETNEDLHFLRNRIRHELMPELERDYNPALPDALRRLADAQGAENEVLDGLTKELLAACAREDDAIDRRAFAEAPLALQRRALLEVAWRHGAEPDFEHVNRTIAFIVEGGTGKRFDLGGGIVLSNGRDQTLILDSQAECVEDVEARLKVPGTTDALGTTVAVARLKGRPDALLADYCSPTRQVFDARALDRGAVLRHRRPGDRIRPYGMEGTRKLNDYLSDLGVPSARRDETLLLTDGDAILWVIGHGISDEAAVSAGATDLYEVTVSDAAE